jgi:hypothetical protein
MDARVHPPCAVCGEPAVTARPNADGTVTPLCGAHRVPAEEREIMQIFEALDWERLKRKILN